MNNTQTIQDFNLSNRPLSFPQLGGTYDYYSLLIYTEVKGHRTYKNRLDKFVSQLAKDLVASAKLVGIEIKTIVLDLFIYYTSPNFTGIPVLADCVAASAIAKASMPSDRVTGISAPLVNASTKAPHSAA